MNHQQNKLNIIIIGPTASGKTKMAIDIAKMFNIPIVNVDSRQFWKDVKILTASPNEDELAEAEHLMFNYLEGDIKPSLGIWLQDMKKIDHKLKIIVGGNGFYINCLLKGISQYNTDNIALKEYTWNDLYNMDNNTKVHKNDYYKIQRHAFFLDNFKKSFECSDNKYTEKSFVIAIIPTKDILYERIKKRADTLVKNSIEEIKKIKHNDNYNNIIGYSEIKEYLNNQISYDKLLDIIILKTYQYAKKQIKFINIMPINYTVDNNILSEELVNMIKKFILSNNNINN